MAIQIPTQNTNKKIAKLAEELRERIKKDIDENCNYVSCTSDMFMALILHFLTEDFEMKNYTMKVKPVRGKHTGDMIQSEMMQIFFFWSLQEMYMMMMLREKWFKYGESVQ
jgi:hypothetical protein